MSFIRSRKNKGIEEWSASAEGQWAIQTKGRRPMGHPNQRVFGFFVTEDRNSKSETEETNKFYSHEGTSPGEETSDGDNFTKDIRGNPHEYCTGQQADNYSSKPSFKNWERGYLSFKPNSTKNSTNPPSTSATSCKQIHRGSKNFKKSGADTKHKRGTDKRNFKASCWKCELCSWKFINISDLHKHYRNDHDITIRYFCGKCDKLFRYFNNYKSHLRGHSDGKSGTTKGSHGGSKNPKEQPNQNQKQEQDPEHICPYCKQRFDDYYALRGHMKDKHILPKMFGNQ